MMKDLMQKNNASLAPIPYDPFRSKSKANLAGPYNNSIATSKGIYAGNTNGDGKLTMDLKTMSMFKKSGTEQAPYVMEWDKNTPMIRTQSFQSVAEAQNYTSRSSVMNPSFNPRVTSTSNLYKNDLRLVMPPP
jgi:hypothetical protein